MIRAAAVVIPLFGWVFFLSPACADEPPGVKLLRPDSLVGWQYGEAPPTGWTLAEGRLTGSPQAAPLLSGWTLGGFTLRLQWSSAKGGAWRILLPDVPAGQGLQVVLAQGEGCGRIEDGQKVLAPGALLSPEQGDSPHLPERPGRCFAQMGTVPFFPRDDKMHEATIRRAGAALTIEVDGRQIAQARIAPDRRFGLGLAVAGGEASLTDLRLAEPPGVPMLNGKDLAGWWTPGSLKAWGIEDGSLVRAGDNGNYLRSEKEYANFTLSMDYKIGKGGNSGIGIRTPRQGWPSGDGMELQIQHDPLTSPMNEHSQMSIYGNVPPLGRADRTSEWNRLVIKADGRMISAWVNGELVQHCNTLHHPELKYRHLKGWIGIQDHGARIEIRDLRVLEAPEGTGLAAWQRPPAPCGASVLLDRLMNSRRLAVADGIRSGVVTRNFSGDKRQQHVLAELSGPGALVRIARADNEGRLAFYFDGEERPRLEAKPGELWRAVPQVAEDANPVLTLLGYRKSLKVVLADAREGEYRFDYVTFPDNLPVQSFQRSDNGIPRAWLSAVAYRHGQCWWGVHREHDPLPRYQSPQKGVKPGKTERLLQVDGAGVVLWTKLRANKKVLENDDLWLEATVDGESRPAIAAPARYWFPGLAGEGNYPNFVMTDRGGVTSLLAMPFGQGITFSASNRGKSNLGGVGITVSVEPAADIPQESASAMRLRGVFLSGQEAARSWFSEQGTGRWVGLVYQQPKGQPTDIAGLVVDGQPAAGWANSTTDLFLGQTGDFRKCLSGRRGDLCWRYLIPDAVAFSRSIELQPNGNAVAPRLALFYVAK